MIPVALLSSFVVLFIGLGLTALVARRRPPGTPLTWGEAFVAATLVFGMFLLGYGIIPNEWLEYADNVLLWRADKIGLGVSTAGVEFGNAAKEMGGAGRVLVSMQSVRDMIAAGIYAAMLVLHVVAWSKWQRRGQKRPEIQPTSVFGRPLMKEV